jgi:transcriptional regulator with XRE-family HTH domain
MMGNRLKNIMKREKVTAYRVCKDLQIDHGNFSRFLHKNGSLSLKKFFQVVGYLGYDIKFVKRKPSRKGSE